MLHILTAFIFYILVTAISVYSQQQCQSCYNITHDQSCSNNDHTFDYSLLHMSVHPHLDAFWINDFEDYYDGKKGNKDGSVRNIFEAITKVLENSRKYRTHGSKSQRAHRSFFNSEIGFFKRWYSEQNLQTKKVIKNLLSTKYWEILGGGYVQHDEGCAYYDDIIQNFELGLHFLKQEFNYYPKIAISADSFGHSQSTAAILAQLGMEGYLVERSDEHILQQKKTEFVWMAKSANNMTYGIMPTHIRWAIHGYQNQFDRETSSQQLCKSKQRFIENLRNQNKFLKELLQSNHIMRYFGHDFQKFDDYQYRVIEAIMEKFSLEKCNRVAAVYGNPTQYFNTLIDEVWGKVKQVSYRTEDIFPIWDYDSGLYWTGYFTTDPYHKKIYRDASRYLYAVRKAYLPHYIKSPNSEHKKYCYRLLQQFSETIAYLQHHDGISGTSKYTVLDIYEAKALNFIKKLDQNILTPVFNEHFSLDSSAEILKCGIINDCQIPEETRGDILVKIFNSGGNLQTNLPIKIKMPQNKFYMPNNCQYLTLCPCHRLPCSCMLYLYPKLFTYTTIRLQNIGQPSKISFIQQFTATKHYSHSNTNFEIRIENVRYSIGYKTIQAISSNRKYEHLDRYGNKQTRTFTIKSGKYALGNNPKTATNIILRKIYQIETQRFMQFRIIWENDMKSIVTIDKQRLSHWKVQTLQAIGTGQLIDSYLEIVSGISNDNKFYTDSNGWLVMKRQLFKHEDYQAYYSPEGYDLINGNTYPMTAFAFIQDSNTKLTVHTDRPQGVISPSQGVLLVNIDRRTSDDGKWVYETTYRNQYQKFTHNIVIGQPNSYPERILQSAYDQPVLLSINQVSPNERIQTYENSITKLQEWTNITKIQEVKFWVRSWNNSDTTLRIQNLNDINNVTLTLFSGHSCPFLTSFYGRAFKFNEIEEMSLGGNLKYSEFLQKKWNTNLNVSQSSQIFNRQFRQNITLRPLEIRTFSLKGLNFNDKWEDLSELKYSKLSKKYQINTKKTMPKRDHVQLQKQLVSYLLEGDHCRQESPILWRQTLQKYDFDFGKENQKSNLTFQRPKPPPKIQLSAIEEQAMPALKEKPKNIYSKLNKIKSLPVTLEIKRTIKIPHDQPIKKPNKNPSIQNQAPIPPMQTSVIISSQIDKISEKVKLNIALTRQEKSLYFDWKLNKIQTNRRVY